MRSRGLATTRQPVVSPFCNALRMLQFRIGKFLWGTLWVHVWILLEKCSTLTRHSGRLGEHVTCVVSQSFVE